MYLITSSYFSNSSVYQCKEWHFEHVLMLLMTLEIFACLFGVLWWDLKWIAQLTPRATYYNYITSYYTYYIYVRFDHNWPNWEENSFRHWLGLQVVPQHQAEVERNMLIYKLNQCLKVNINILKDAVLFKLGMSILVPMISCLNKALLIMTTHRRWLPECSPFIH